VRSEHLCPRWTTALDGVPLAFRGGDRDRPLGKCAARVIVWRLTTSGLADLEGCGARVHVRAGDVDDVRVLRLEPVLLAALHRLPGSVSRHDITGWRKAGWCVFVIVLPFLGIFVYLIANGSGMAERRTKEAVASQAQMDAYVRSVAGSRDPAGEIAKAKDLLERNAITQDEFDKLKADALAG
jgi:hypothetical protein